MIKQQHGDAAITARGATVVKDKKPILSALSFRVRKGTITGLLGPSGAGKTTLMRSIVGVQQLTKGTLKVLGLPAGDKRLRSRIGYVTQSPAIYHDLTVRQNVRYFATLTRASADDVERVIHKVRLDEQAKQLVETLSGGQKARVSLAIALLGDPELLVLDEPTVGLDPLLRRELWLLFRQLADKGKTLVISSHVMDEAEHCDDLLLVREGDIIWNDSKERLLERTKKKTVEDAFLQLVEGR
jgi:ABC-2 type transport system ATP-binding protein